MSTLKIHILCGLPASGKTHSIKTKICPHQLCMDFNFDKEIKYNKDEKDPLGACLDRAVKFIRGNTHVKHFVLDGLFTTNDDYEKILKKLTESLCGEEKTQYIFHFWEEDRESCLWNDRGRREKDSIETIKHCPLERPNVEKLRQINDSISLKIHSVERKPEAVVWAADLNETLLDKNIFLRSSGWSLGGTWGNYHGEQGFVAPDPQPSFDELDQLLEKVCPNITYLQYKRVFSECVRIEDKTSCGNYGGHTKIAHYVCNIETLYDHLVEKGLIQKIEEE